MAVAAVQVTLQQVLRVDRLVVPRTPLPQRGPAETKAIVVVQQVTATRAAVVGLVLPVLGQAVAVQVQPVLRLATDRP